MPVYDSEMYSIPRHRPNTMYIIYIYITIELWMILLGNYRNLYDSESTIQLKLGYNRRDGGSMAVVVSRISLPIWDYQGEA